MDKKYKTELNFQKKWAKIFPQNKDKVLQYWKKYRAFDKIQEETKITPISNILDVGCGISTVLHFLSGNRIGYDPLIKEYQKIYKYPKGIEVYDEWIFIPEYFDVIFCSNVLDHVEKPEEILSNIYKTLRKNGHFILTVNIFTEQKERDEAHPYCFSKNDVWNLIKRKFHIIYLEENDWYGLKNYVENKTKIYGKELVLILQKM